MVKIVVAQEALAPGTVLDTGKHVGWMEVPASSKDLVAMAIPPDIIENVNGRQVNQLIPAKTPILYSHFKSVLDLDIPAGEVALSLPVSGSQALSGLLVPGDHVKLVITRPVEENEQTAPEISGDSMQDVVASAITAGMAKMGPGKFESVLVSDKKFKILAVGSRLSGSRQRFGGLYAEGTQRSAGYSSVTLAVTEEEALQILEQTGGGQNQTTLLLCPEP